MSKFFARSSYITLHWIRICNNMFSLRYFNKWLFVVRWEPFLHLLHTGYAHGRLPPSLRRSSLVATQKVWIAVN